MRIQICWKFMFTDEKNDKNKQDLHPPLELQFP